MPAILLVACGGPVEGDRGVRSVAVEGTVTTLEAIAADPLQATLLDDGKVTAAEMERALLAVVACVEQDGYEARLVEFTAGGEYEFFVDAGGDAAGDESRRSFDACKERMLSDVELVYQEQHAPSEAEVDQGQQRVVECLVDRGYDRATLDGWPLADEVAPRDLAACMQAAED